MNFIFDVYEAIIYRFGHEGATMAEMVSMLLMILIFSLYEFLVYGAVSHKSMYNKSFHISIMVIPFFIGAIIMALQSNIVITLGTIGALAIIRFRTAVKDPIDMIYILWSIFIGIMCGCKLYELCGLTSIVVTIVLFVSNCFENKGLVLFKNPYILIINSSENKEKEINEIIKKYTKSFRIKSRNYSSNSYDYVYQIQAKNPTCLLDDINKLNYVGKSSLLEYDSEDII